MFSKLSFVMAIVLATSMAWAGLKDNVEMFQGYDDQGQEVTLEIRTVSHFQGARTEIELTVGNEILRLTDFPSASFESGAPATAAVIFSRRRIGYGARAALQYNAVYNEVFTLDVIPEGFDGDEKVTVKTGRLSSSRSHWSAELERVTP